MNSIRYTRTQTEEDILCRDKLDALAAKYPGRFKLWYTLDRPDDAWQYSKGFIDAAMIRDKLGFPAPSTCICPLC